MKPSVRLKFVKEIASRLSDVSWREIDRTLKAFGFPIASSWNGNGADYVGEMVADGDAKQLADLAEHLGFTDDEPAKEPDFWKPGDLRLFISHLSGDRAAVHEIKGFLEDYGISAFVAHDDIEPTREWQLEIEAALQTMDVLVAMLTPEFHQSKWCDQEVGFALGRKKLVLAVQCGAVPHGFIGKSQGLKVDIKGNKKVIAANIAKLLGKNPITAKPIVQGLISRLAEAGSFDSANRIAKEIVEHNFFDDADVAAIEKAVVKNAQAKHGFEVPTAIEHVKKKAALKSPVLTTGTIK